MSPEASGETGAVIAELGEAGLVRSRGPSGITWPLTMIEFSAWTETGLTIVRMMRANNIGMSHHTKTTSRHQGTRRDAWLNEPVLEKGAEEGLPGGNRGLWLLLGGHTTNNDLPFAFESNKQRKHVTSR